MNTPDKRASRKRSAVVARPLTRRERSVAQLRRLALRFPQFRLCLGDEALGFGALTDVYIFHLREVLRNCLRVHRRARAGAVPAHLALHVQGIDGELSARERARQAELSERLARATADLARIPGVDQAEGRAALRGDMDALVALGTTRAQRHAARLLEAGLRDPEWRPTRADAVVAHEGLVAAVAALAEVALNEHDRLQAGPSEARAA